MPESNENSPGVDIATGSAELVTAVVVMAIPAVVATTHPVAAAALSPVTTHIAARLAEDGVDRIERGLNHAIEGLKANSIFSQSNSNFESSNELTGYGMSTP